MKNRSIANELRVSYHRNEKLSVEDFKTISSSKLMEKVFRKIWNTDELDVRESFYAIFFNNRLDVVGYRKIADGGLDSIMIDIRLLMSSGLLCNALRFAVAHNHPSGTLRPSGADRALTRKIIEAGNILNMELLDHIILTTDSYYSFRDEGDI